jgi:hypothetical protein
MFETKKMFAKNLRGFFGIFTITLLIIGCHAKPPQNTVKTRSNSNVVETKNQPDDKVSKIKFSSVYTKLDSKTCKPFSKPASDEDEVSELCEGYKDYKVFINHHGTATQIYIGTGITADSDSWNDSDLPSFVANSAGNGQTIEWRLADGEPFACIVRAEYDKSIINPDEKGFANELVVKSLKGFTPISITIDAQKNKRANEEAQRRADAAYIKP